MRADGKSLFQGFPLVSSRSGFFFDTEPIADWFDDIYLLIRASCKVNQLKALKTSSMTSPRY